MNYDAAGVGSWLLRSVRPVCASLDAPAAHVLIDQKSFARWQAERCGAEDEDPAHAAMIQLLREVWRDELDDSERAVLRGLHLEDKNMAAVGRALGLHHSAVGRIRRRAEEKLRDSIGYALRYRELMREEKQKERGEL